MRIDPRISKISLTQNRKKLKVGDASAWSFEQVLASSGTVTFTEIAANTSQEQTVTIAGAAVGDAVCACPATDLGDTALHWSARVSTDNTVKVRVSNPTAGPVTPSAVAWRVVVFKA